MDIVIGMPLNISIDPHDVSKSDIIFRPQGAGFVELQMGLQFRNLPKRDGSNWEINKTAFRWSDRDNYLLRSRFINWFKSVVVKSLNKFEANERFEPVYEVDGIEYTIGRSESGPAITLKIENIANNFKMDVDLVPALKFPENRWPLNDRYRKIPPSCTRDFWLVVPKPNRDNLNDINRISRSWRLALHYQERELIQDSYNLRPALRLVCVIFFLNINQRAEIRTI